MMAETNVIWLECSRRGGTNNL